MFELGDQLTAASRLCRFRSGSLPASVATRFRLRYIAGKAHPASPQIQAYLPPRAARDGFRTPSRNPRRGSISSVTHRRDQRLISVKIRPDVSASLPARLAGELGLNIAQSNVIRPSIAADRCGVAATINLRRRARVSAITDAPGYSEANANDPAAHPRSRPDLDPSFAIYRRTRSLDGQRTAAPNDSFAAVFEYHQGRAF
jgi:hypothetical protein